MGSWSQKRVRESSKSGNLSRVELGRYAPMIGVRFPSVMTAKLTMFGLWKRVDSKL